MRSPRQGHSKAQASRSASCLEPPRSPFDDRGPLSDPPRPFFPPHLRRRCARQCVLSVAKAEETALPGLGLDGLGKFTTRHHVTLIAVSRGSRDALVPVVVAKPASWRGSRQRVQRPGAPTPRLKCLSHHPSGPVFALPTDSTVPGRHPAAGAIPDVLRGRPCRPAHSMPSRPRR